MKSSNIDYIPQIDHLRLLAAMLVIAFHVFHYYFGHWQPFPQLPVWGLVTEGHTGVALFFVLSGFIFMTISLQGRPIIYWEFLRNRCLRILPLFLVFYFVATAIGRDDFRPEDIFYLLFSNLGKAPTSDTFVTGAAWTISVEFTFYLVFPFLAYFVREQGMGYLFRLIAILAVVKLAAYGTTDRSTHMFYSTLVGRFDQFLWGMLAACIHHTWHTHLKRYGLLVFVVGSLLVFLAVGIQARHASFFLASPKQVAWIYWGTIEAVAWCVFILGYLNAALKFPVWLDRSLTKGGEWSYSLYFWHGMLIFLAHRYLGVLTPFGRISLDVMVNFVIVLPLILGFAALSYKTIEAPFLGLRHRYIRVQ